MRPPSIILMFFVLATSSFRIDNTDHIFDVNKNENTDQVDLVCPQSAAAAAAAAANGAKASNGSIQEQEHYIIYSVTKEEYDTCRLSGASQQRTVAKCDQQQAQRPFTVTFRSFSPQPGGLEFKAGQEYYFITALLHQSDPVRRFGPCRDQNMKVIFKVCCTKPANLLPAAAQINQRPPPPPQTSTRRPQTVPVITLKPSYQPPAKPLLRESNHIQQQQPQQQQPFTVYPIEELHQPAQASTSSAQPVPEIQPTERPDAQAQPQQQESTRNDIQNDKPTVASTFNSRQPPSFVKFDPTASPEDIIKLYSPTPLPARHPHRLPTADFSAQRDTRHQQHQQQQQQQQQVRPAEHWHQSHQPHPLLQQHPANRLHFYPHHGNHQHQLASAQPMPQTHEKQLNPADPYILPPDQRQAAGGGGSSGQSAQATQASEFSVYLASLLLLPGLLLVALVIKLHRSWRRHDSHSQIAEAAALAAANRRRQQIVIACPSLRR